jgi:AcrR family transcriptional regulator
VPKVVDHELRRREIGEALWRVVRRDGVHGATVRAVAAEAGWSASALRHYFTSQDELLTFTMQLVADRAAERIAALPAAGDPRARAEQALSEVLPLDADRRLENAVWMAFNARALTDPALRAVQDSTYDAIHALCRRVVADLVVDQPPAGRRLLAHELNVLLDGLAVHAALRPSRWPPRQLRRVLSHYLDRLAERR